MTQGDNLPPLLKRAMIYMEDAKRLMISEYGHEFTAEYLYALADEVATSNSRFLKATT